MKLKLIKTTATSLNEIRQCLIHQKNSLANGTTVNGEYLLFIDKNIAICSDEITKASGIAPKLPPELLEDSKEFIKQVEALEEDTVEERTKILAQFPKFQEFMNGVEKAMLVEVSTKLYEIESVKIPELNLEIAGTLQYLDGAGLISYLQ